jgi:restriction system protein
MAIWVYKGVSHEPYHVWSGDTCTFCRSRMKLLHEQADDISTIKTYGSYDKRVFVCPVCGWWKADGSQTIDDFVHHAQFRSVHGAAASLRELDLTDISTPIEEVRSYLAARFEDRCELNPKVFEKLVASVFGNLGYSAVVTGQTGDAGIDVILQNTHETIGVQVKRYKDSVEVEQIRSLAGALVLNDLTSGIFVTTSRFQSGAEPTAKKYAARGYKIELMDAKRVYDALSIAQREMYGSFEDFPVAECLNRLVMLEDYVLNDKYIDLPFVERF